MTNEQHIEAHKWMRERIQSAPRWYMAPGKLAEECARALSIVNCHDLLAQAGEIVEFWSFKYEDYVSDIDYFGGA
jgi:hypothetical protein